MFRVLLSLTLLGMLLWVSTAPAVAQEFATDRLFMKQHKRTLCEGRVQREVEAEQERPVFTGEQQRQLELDAWNRKRKGIPLTSGQQGRLQQMLQGAPPPRLPSRQEINRNKTYRNRALERQC